MDCPFSSVMKKQKGGGVPVGENGHFAVNGRQGGTERVAPAASQRAGHDRSDTLGEVCWTLQAGHRRLQRQRFQVAFNMAHLLHHVLVIRAITKATHGLTGPNAPFLDGGGQSART